MMVVAQLGNTLETRHDTRMGFAYHESAHDTLTGVAYHTEVIHSKLLRSITVSHFGEVVYI